MKVMKFGGSSVATAERIRRVAAIVRDARERGPVVVVVSALGGATDALLAVAHQAAAGDAAYVAAFEEVADRHRATLAEIAAGGCDEHIRDEHIRDEHIRDEHIAVRRAIAADLADLHDLLHGTFLIREASPRTVDSVLSYGERLSAPLVAAALRVAGLDAAPCDARRLIVTDRAFGSARVDIAATETRTRAYFAPADLPLQVVTGFVGATPVGETTTLGRGGSDYTASLLGAALDAADVEIWTDASGVLSADPRLVPEAAPIVSLGYDELMELSHFGAKVIHPPSVHPARRRGLRLWIKNTFAPDDPGTRVDIAASADPADPERPVRGVASIRRVALLRIEGDGMVGVPGIASRVFGALARREINIVLITQASSEHSICLAIAPGDLEAAGAALDEELTLERGAGWIDPLVVEKDLSVIAAVGAGMRHRAGIAGRLFGVLGSHGVNVRAVAQGSSELNISVVVDAADEARAVRAIHDAFVFPRRRKLAVTLVGVGGVGGALLEQLSASREGLRAHDLRVELRGVANSRVALRARGEGSLEREGIAKEDVLARLVEDGQPYELEELIADLVSAPAAHRVFVDCTASDAVPDAYLPLLAAGVHVVTANKRRPAGSLADWRALRAAGPGRFLHEATVGAGLPVVRTLETLVATGDRVRRIEGVLSGTLAYLADRLASGAAFSEAVRQAHALGYTEPDPRDDLDGADVARKLLILGRLSGRDLEPGDIQVEGLLPDASWLELSLDTFWKRLPELDAPFAQRRDQAAAEGRRLCYLARLDNTSETTLASVALTALAPEHPCGALRGTDNLLAITTERYNETPLVVRGPGAGTAVTAAGVFGDVLRAIGEV